VQDREEGSVEVVKLSRKLRRIYRLEAGSKEEASSFEEAS
jgi:hypothetical protein